MRKFIKIEFKEFAPSDLVIAKGEMTINVEDIILMEALPTKGWTLVRLKDNTNVCTPTSLADLLAK